MLEADIYESYLSNLERMGFSGRICRDWSTRIVHATDASIYQIIPEAVLFPRHAEDVSLLIQLASRLRYQEITFSARGGGTSTCGQSLNRGVMIDFSRFMTHVKEMDPATGRITVEPGVQLDKINQLMQAHGWWVPILIAISNRAVAGGLVSTDACGKASRYFGRISRYVEAVTCVLMDGSIVRFKAEPLAQLDALMRLPGQEGHIYKEVFRLITENQADICEAFPPSSRHRTGYNLAGVIDPVTQTINLAQLICGSEGTLGIITEITFQCVTIPAVDRLFVIKYDTFESAIRDAPDLLTWNPVSLETVDSTVLRMAGEDPLFFQLHHLVSNDATSGIMTRSLSLVEFMSDSESDMRTLVDSLQASLDARVPGENGFLGYHRIFDPEDISMIWQVRDKGAAAIHGPTSRRKPISFIEDTSVSPEVLPDYIRELSDLLNSYELQFGFYGHSDIGVMHVRPALNTQDPADVALIKTLSDEVAMLVAKYNGNLWSEHGKGFRSDYATLILGDVVYETMREIKSLFDPQNRLNPGKVATPGARNNRLYSVISPFKGDFDSVIPLSVQDKFARVFDCNGNGCCMLTAPGALMCPSFKFLRDRIHSPKGRAAMIREWLRQNPKLPEKRSFIRRAIATFTQIWEDDDITQLTYKALSECLACKACATLCPAQVDIAEYRSRFLEAYYGLYLRPVRHYVASRIEGFSRLYARLAPFMNIIFSLWFIHRLVRMIGYITIPRYSTPTLKHRLKVLRVPIASHHKIERLNEDQRKRTVLIMQDLFSSFFDAPVVEDAIQIMIKLGFQPMVLPYVPLGKPKHIKGLRSRFSRLIMRSMAVFQQFSEYGIPIVGIDPEMVMVFRDEMPKTLQLENVKFPVLLFQEWLLDYLLHRNDAVPVIQDEHPGYMLFGHCIERALAEASQSQWQAIYKAFGLSLSLADVGCCGMSGIYGYETHHYRQSRSIFNLSWKSAIESCRKQGKTVLVTSYSCRTQVHRFMNFRPIHPVQALLQVLYTPEHY